MTREELLRRMPPDLRKAYQVLPPNDITSYSEVIKLRAGSLAFYRSQPPAAEKHPNIQMEVVSFPRESEKGQLTVRIYYPREATGLLPVILNAHGGGTILYSAEEDDPYCLDMAEKFQCLVVNVDYRLAPEFPAPAGQLDYCMAWRWLVAHAGELNADVNRAVFSGVSGGGNIVVGATLRLLDQGERLPVLVMVPYPMLDDRNITRSSREIVDTGVWGRPQNLAAWNYYLNGLNGTATAVDCYAAPARRKDFTGFPPVFTFVGELDPFRDETIAFVAALLSSNVPVSFTLYPGGFHCFDRYVPDSTAAQQAQQAMDVCLTQAILEKEPFGG